MESDLPQGQDSIEYRITGNQVRRYFIDQKSAVLRKKYRPNPKWDTDEFWTKVGELCTRLNARPDLFVMAQFAGDPARHGPFPNAITGKAAARRWVDWLNQNRMPDEQASVTSEMKVDTTIVARALHYANQQCLESYPGQPIIVGYRSPMIDIPAWLRILMAPGDPDIVRDWGVTGKEELQENPILMNQCNAAGLPVAKVLEIPTP